MKKNISTKQIIIIVIVLAILGLVYFYISGKPDVSSDLAGDSSVQSPVSDEATKIIALLNQTVALRIDPAIFNSAVYKSLVDHTVEVIPQPIGKPNPFIYTVPAPPAAPAKR
jgi:hypothetical protein